MKHRPLVAWLQAAPLAAVFVVFFLVPLGLIVMVSFWQATDYELIPAFTLQAYADIFNGCGGGGDDTCVTLKTYASTLKFSLLTWLLTGLIGFTVAYFLAFHVRSTLTQTVLFIVCTVPFWTSNVIRMISWIPLLGRNGLDINDPTDKYTLKALPGSFSGLHLLAIMYTAFRQIDPTMDTGVDFAAEYKAAMEMRAK